MFSDGTWICAGCIIIADRILKGGKKNEIARRIENLEREEGIKISELRNYYDVELREALLENFDRLHTAFFSPIEPLKHESEKLNSEINEIEEELKRPDHKIDEISEVRQMAGDKKREINRLEDDLSRADEVWIDSGERQSYTSSLRESIRFEKNSLLDLDDRLSRLTDELERLRSEQPHLLIKLGELRPIRDKAVKKYEAASKPYTKKWNLKKDRIWKELEEHYTPKYNSKTEKGIADIQKTYNKLIHNVPGEVQLEVDKLKGRYF